MTTHDIRIFGDPVLTSRADEISTFDDSLKHLVEDMFDTMDAAGGAGDSHDAGGASEAPAASTATEGNTK